MNQCHNNSINKISLKCSFDLFFNNVSSVCCFSVAFVSFAQNSVSCTPGTRRELLLHQFLLVEHASSTNRLHFHAVISLWPVRWMERSIEWLQIPEKYTRGMQTLSITKWKSPGQKMGLLDVDTKIFETKILLILVCIGRHCCQF